MNSEDAAAYGFSDEPNVRLITEAGEETVEIEVSNGVRKGQVIIPHGFGLIYDGKKFGANVNRLTKKPIAIELRQPLYIAMSPVELNCYKILFLMEYTFHIYSNLFGEGVQSESKTGNRLITISIPDNPRCFKSAFIFLGKME